MKRAVNIIGGLLGSLALGALVVALALTFGELQKEAKPASQAFQSPIETPTQSPYPPPATQTPPQSGTPTAVSTPPELRAENIRIEREVQLTFEDLKPLFPNVFWSPQSEAVLVSRPNGRTIKTVTSTYVLGELWVIPLNGSTPRKLTASGDWGKWSKDGEWIAYGSLTGPTTQKVYTMRNNGSNILEVAIADRAPIDWLPSNDLVYVDNGQLWVIDPRQKSPRVILPTLDLDTSRDDTFLLSPTGHHLVYLRQSTLFLIEVGATRPIELTNTLISNHGYRPDLTWSPDGRWLVYIDLEGSTSRLQLVDIERLQVNTIYADKHFHLRQPSWVPGSQIILFSRYPRGAEAFECCAKIFAVNTDGSGLNDLTGDRVPQQYPEISPDGAKIAFFRDKSLWVTFLNVER